MPKRKQKEEAEEQEEQEEQEDANGKTEGGLKDDALEGDKQPQKKKAAKKKAAEVFLQTERRVVARKPALGHHQRTFKVISWNVNGLNGIINGKNATNGNKTTNILQELLAREGGDVDVLFLQETKLQESRCEAFEHILPGYVAYWSCSKTKKGYAGVAAFVKEEYVRGKAAPGGKQQKLASFFQASGKKKGSATEEGAKGAAAASSSSSSSSSSFEVLGVKYGCVGDKDEDEEGRVVTLEFAGFWLVGVYVANSGMKLERLQHRLKTFNPRFQEYLAALNKAKPVLVMGDFNVAPLDLDCYNAGAKHLVKVPGLTPEEREAHAAWLGTGWEDTFRYASCSYFSTPRR
jgi:exonuclease III